MYVCSHLCLHVLHLSGSKLQGATYVFRPVVGENASNRYPSMTDASTWRRGLVRCLAYSTGSQDRSQDVMAYAALAC